jgi:signal transduction histidine kinase
MLSAGEIGTMLYAIYPWIVIGNGFRFGRWYLHYSQALAVAGFATLLFLSAPWSHNATLGAALLLVLLAVPWYVSLLLAGLQATHERLKEARGQAEAANRAKTKFLAAASHDLRQPMQALSMYASVLEARVRDARSRRVVHGIQLSVRTLEQLFDSLLDISKIESGVIKPNLMAFPLMPLVEQVIEAEWPMAERKNLDLRTVRTSLSVRSDPALLARMLKNLVTNAIRYTDRGRVIVGCRRLGAGRVRLEVVDSGVGIASGEHGRIFEEYYQLPGASAQGLGLGLPIVKSLGELLGHAVAVRSAPGRGSVFSIELESAGAGAAALDPERNRALEPQSGLHGLSVVLVEDDAEICNSMRLLLESWGCRYIGGTTVAEVEGKLEAQRVRPDALIADYRLAEATTGVQAIERLRLAFGADLPALVITGTVNVPLLQQRVPGIPVASKPLPPSKLRAFLAQALRQRGNAARSISAA